MIISRIWIPLEMRKHTVTVWKKKGIKNIKETQIYRLLRSKFI